MNPRQDNEQPESPDDSETTKSSKKPQKSWLGRSLNPFRIATLRGLGILLPPLLTIIFFIWAWSTIETAILRPAEGIGRRLIVWSIADIREDSEVREAARTNKSALRTSSDGTITYFAPSGQPFLQIGNKWVPDHVYEFVKVNHGGNMPTNADSLYMTFAGERFLKRHLVIPAFLAAFVAFLYLTGKLMAAGVGRIFYNAFEGLINRLPIISNVYSSVKQVTDFAFSENEVQFNRVVALEYPRKGIWSMGFVTGESMLDIKNAAGEPMLSVLMPTSPMPATGFTISIPKSETIDLDITIDQAIQFCVSCGVVVPDHQQPKSTIDGEVRRRFKQQADGTLPALSNSEDSEE